MARNTGGYFTSWSEPYDAVLPQNSANVLPSGENDGKVKVDYKWMWTMSQRDQTLTMSHSLKERKRRTLKQSMQGWNFLALGHTSRVKCIVRCRIRSCICRQHEYLRSCPCGFESPEAMYLLIRELSLDSQDLLHAIMVNDIYNIMKKPESKNADEMPDRVQVLVIPQENLKLSAILFHHRWHCTLIGK